MSKSLGILVKLLHEAEGHIVTVELKSGEAYRGSLIECEDNWNSQLESVTYTAMDGKVSQLEHVSIRGSKVRFMIIPDILKNAPMFKRLDTKIKARSAARGSVPLPMLSKIIEFEDLLGSIQELLCCMNILLLIRQNIERLFATHL
ncbi:small nuclear ribonucleoprotein SmD3b isoform X2 [Physcomitrium patens]|uniref:Small nuclear ribonucleoprotein Sm D3 n=1 Tax=Physcomitrium patens TaxID=3218 RepID=A0A7I4FFL0_PHYPA